MLEAVVHDAVRGSYSAAAVQGGGGLSGSALGSRRSVISTVPSDNSAFGEPNSVGLASSVQAPVAGSYSSADHGSPREDPSTSAWPLGSTKAAMTSRSACIFAIAVHDPVSGSYSSAASVGSSPGAWPPATSTLPS